MDEYSKTALPCYLEIILGGTLYKVTSIFADKGNLQTLWDELIITKTAGFSDCMGV